MRSLVKLVQKNKRFLRRSVGQTAEMCFCGRGQILKKGFFFRKRPMYNAAKAQGSAKFQRGNGGPCVFSERAALAGYRPEAVKRGEKNRYEIRSSYFAPQLPVCCGCHHGCTGSDGLRRLFQLRGSFFRCRFYGVLCSWHCTGRHPGTSCWRPRFSPSTPAGGHRRHLLRGHCGLH